MAVKLFLSSLFLSACLLLSPFPKAEWLERLPLILKGPVVFCCVDHYGDEMVPWGLTEVTFFHDPKLVINSLKVFQLSLKHLFCPPTVHLREPTFEIRWSGI